MFGGGRGRNTLVCRGIIICHRGVLWHKINVSGEGEGSYDLPSGIMVAENLSMAVHQGNYYVLGGYGKFFPPQGCFLLTQIAHCVQGSVYALCMLT